MSKVAKQDIPRSIRMKEEVWEKLDADAERCRRSAAKQIEAILVSVYKLGSVNIKLDESSVNQENTRQQDGN